LRNIRVPVSEQDEESIQESFVLVLVTGGTLCMMKNNEGKRLLAKKNVKNLSKIEILAKN